MPSPAEVITSDVGAPQTPGAGARRWRARARRGNAGVLSSVLTQTRRDKLALGAAVILVLFILVAVFGPALVPYDPTERTRGAEGGLAYLESPSSEHLLGTTNLGRDVFSQLVVGARAALIIGGIAAFAEVVFGVLLGLVAGYFKGFVDNVIMRALDIAYALPLEPVAIVLLVFMGQNLWTVILAIVLLSWRQAARVIRAQVLSVSSRSFVKGARVAGASHWRIMTRHILPNVLPIALVYLPIGFGNAIVAEAAISFLGFGDPTVTTWGQMLHDVFAAGATDTAMWWVLSPGIAITVVVGAVFFMTRAFEDVLNPRLSASRR